MNDLKVNKQIRASYVILIDSNGENKGKVTFFNALQQAESQGLDLVMVDDQQIPICKIIDYGKIKFEKKKKDHKSKSKKSVQKEIRFGMNISDHDLETKNNKVRTFLEKGYVVKYVLQLKGNNRNFTKDRVSSFFNKAIEEFKENSLVTPAASGDNQVYSIISPK